MLGALSRHGGVFGGLSSVPSKVHEVSPISDATIARSRFPTVLQPKYPSHSNLDHRVSIARVPASYTGVPDGAPAWYRRPYPHLPTVRPTGRRRPRPADDQTLDKLVMRLIG